jgi:four helix bundle protein
MDKIEKINALKERTRIFALSIIRFYQTLPKTNEAKIMGTQLLKSGTSVGANYRAACRARSDAEFYSKICIVVEEIDEVDYWLDLFLASGIVEIIKINDLVQETLELIKIFVTIKTNAKK